MWLPDVPLKFAVESYIFLAVGSFMLVRDLEKLPVNIVGSSSESLPAVAGTVGPGQVICVVPREGPKA